MVSNIAVATEVKWLVEEAKDRLLESMEAVEKGCPPEEYVLYKRAVGQVVSRMLTKIVEPLLRRNPSLKAEGWRAITSPNNDAHPCMRKRHCGTCLIVAAVSPVRRP